MADSGVPSLPDPRPLRHWNEGQLESTAHAQPIGEPRDPSIESLHWRRLVGSSDLDTIERLARENRSLSAEIRAGRERETALRAQLEELCDACDDMTRTEPFDIAALQIERVAQTAREVLNGK